ncbi:acyl-CoA synthetase [Sphingorhabdus pulchriflava]|uniref:Acyl-CoA synthetase n=1 Tax=Sphingorhabdus pulchriflava TaxID=2292257 RepID=A0A371BHP4_9SPHN|nr:acyl-CoA synthetase [Sphingorhabdus pulchriflava]RDV07119.1 acyl-CoA synthetase [Sphingorhabdus pulchriflava]
MIWHFADVFDTIASLAPDQIALINGDTHRSWRDYEDRSARLANALLAAGLKPDAKTAIYAHNSNAYLEAQYASFKARTVPINVNYRYVEHELTYLFDNGDVEAVFFDAKFAPRLAAIRDHLPKLKLFVQIDDGSGETLAGAQDFEALIATNAPLPRLDYGEDDIYMIYTGGTTGMPKGVMYRHGDLSAGIASALLGPEVVEPSPEMLVAVVQALKEAGAAPISLPACPLMHGTGMWIGAFFAHFAGGAVATISDEKFDPDAIWAFIERKRVNAVAIVGDAFAKPMLAALREAEARGQHYDLTSLKVIGSSGVMFSSEVKRGLLEYIDVEIRDSIGSTEGAMGGSVVSRSLPPVDTAKFAFNPTTKVFNDRDEEVQPGSDEIGMIANGGVVPVGYFKDPEKSAKTFRSIAGVRYSFPGDFAQVTADGTLVLLGRGSVCINTGGEKVFPEEVEEALKAHGDIWDALVVGVPDERFGERVVAVLSAKEGASVNEAALLDFARTRLAGYKMPRQLVFVETVQRAANGKADYKWAKEVALGSGA